MAWLQVLNCSLKEAAIALEGAMRRREFIAGFGGAAAWTTLAQAQQPDRPKRIGVLQSNAAADPEARSNLSVFEKNLERLGWTIGRSVVIDYRWADGDFERVRSLAKEMLSVSPDVMLASGIPSVAALLKETRTIPIVFARVSAPVELGFVATLARPGGNATGFSNFDYSMGGKWLQTLQEVASDVRRVMVIGSALDGYFNSIAANSASLSVEPIKVAVRNRDDVTRAFSSLGESREVD
jgi:putative ABC transport system substrate-binding protein